MKTIESIEIWNNGILKTASVLDSTANVNLNNNATFNYVLYSLNESGSLFEIISSGSLYMDSEIYATWTQDDIAWDFIANSLNLTIIGDYIPPQIIVENVANNLES